jgi:DNA repair protein RecO (recombination protein O)
VVLARAARGDSDLAITFLTGEKGLITAVAKNARQSVRRFGGNLLRPGTAAWYHFRQRPGRYMAFVERGEVNPRAPVLPADPVCMALAAWALELVRAFEAHENPAPETFNLLLRHLGALSKAGDYAPPALGPRRLSVIFTQRYLGLAGFAPPLGGCAVCSRRDSASWWWDPAGGGLLCQDCAPGLGRGPRKMPEGLVPALRAAKKPGGLEALGEAGLLSAESFFGTLATLQAGRGFKSLKVLRELLGGR